MILTKPRKTLATCCGVHAIHDGISDIMYVLLPALQQSFGLSLTEVGLVRGAHRAGLAIFQLPAGLLAERLGERSLLVIGTAIADWLCSTRVFRQFSACFSCFSSSEWEAPRSIHLVPRSFRPCIRVARRARLGHTLSPAMLGNAASRGPWSLTFYGNRLAGTGHRPGSVAFFTAVVVLLSLISVEVGGRPDTPPAYREKSKSWAGEFRSQWDSWPFAVS